MRVKCTQCDGGGLFNGAVCGMCHGAKEYLLEEIDVPPAISSNNDHDCPSGLFYGFNDLGRLLYNFLYEYVDRNPDKVFPTNVFKLSGFTNEQIIIIQKILDGGRFNLSVIAADFVSGNYYDFDEAETFVNE